MIDTTDRITFGRLSTLTGWPADLNPERLAEFLHSQMAPYHDSREDTLRGVRDAVERGGFIVVALDERELVGAGVLLATGMRGYVPENLLLFLAVAQTRRNQGIGRRLIERILANCQGGIKLHVEYDNPARALYERMGFRSTYAEMRLCRE